MIKKRKNLNKVKISTILIPTPPLKKIMHKTNNADEVKNSKILKNDLIKLFKPIRVISIKLKKKII